jgi:hypothetical protein
MAALTNSVAAADPLRQPTLEAEAFRGGHDVLAAERLTDLDRRARTREYVDDGQRSKPSSARQSVRCAPRRSLRGRLR